MGFRRRKDRGVRTDQAPWLITIWVDGKRLRRTVDGELTREQVKDAEAEFRREARATRAAARRDPSAALTVAHLIERYWSEHGQHIRSWRTEKSALELWSRELGPATPAAAVTADRIASVMARWRSETVHRRAGVSPLSPGAMNRRLSVLQRLWRRAEDLWGAELARIPWGRLKQFEGEPEDRSLTAEERARLIEHWPAGSRHAVLFAMVTGLRRGAVLRLTGRDLDWTSGVIHAVSKGRGKGKPTPIEMTEPVLAVLQSMGRLPEVGRLFPISTRQLRRHLEKAREAARLPTFRFHDTRHSLAQDLEDAGLGDVIPDALHHSSPALRRRYAKARLQRVSAAVTTALRRGTGG